MPGAAWPMEMRICTRFAPDRAALPDDLPNGATYPFAFGTEYWTNWPTADNNYNIAANWWAQFLFVIGGITPATQ